MLIGQMTGAQVECVELVDIGALIAMKSESLMLHLQMNIQVRLCFCFILALIATKNNSLVHFLYMNIQITPLTSFELTLVTVKP